MGLAQPEDFIAKQGTNGLRLWIDLTNIINDQGMKIATLEQLLQKSDMSKELVQIRKAREFCETYILSVPVLMDTPELACFDDYANTLCSGNADLFDWMSMSLSSWLEAHEDLSELRLKRQIGYISGVFGASSRSPWTATGSDKRLSMHGKELYCQKQLLLSLYMVLEASLQTIVRWLAFCKRHHMELCGQI